MTATDKILNDILLKQLTWKPGPIRNAARCIVETALEKRTFYPDEVDLGTVEATDRNVIGSAFRMLTKANVIAATGYFRRSTRGPSNGRKVFEYRLNSKRLAETFLTRNGWITPSQVPDPKADQQELAI